MAIAYLTCRTSPRQCHPCGQAHAVSMFSDARMLSDGCAWQALAERSAQDDPGAEKQVVQLLSIPLDSYDVVTVLALDKYPTVMALLSPATCKVGAHCCSEYVPHCWVPCCSVLMMKLTVLL